MKPDPVKQPALQQLQQRLGHTFQRPELLEQALTHRSFSSRNNERFEFVGDAILNYTVAKMLFETFPELPEGRLSRMRANLVNQETLAGVAVSLNVGGALFLGSGELKSGGFNRPSILADALEAIFAAISFDAGFNTAEQTVRRLFAQRVTGADAEGQGGKDAKTLLQETLQARRLALPKYRIEAQHGEGCHTEFTVSCDLGELGCITTAKAGSRRTAEQQAAKQALAWLSEKYSG
ncbi:MULTISPECIES: ribonuclease III [unclassified Neisseria]|uniref:ribonuclease III n=1 Tax=unclassified Neisseria TaxID=2623750 RepID=UPI0010727358|nr:MULTISPECIES: ribonuclease III [unclassified Neisseria]MBF0802833.1 ribonuclease III [Neisseria sp. 19428wB4_WF04]TFU44621.1 ribonuclease III [Neisseria sp. WF04]